MPVSWADTGVMGTEPVVLKLPLSGLRRIERERERERERKRGEREKEIIKEKERKKEKRERT